MSTTAPTHIHLNHQQTACQGDVGTVAGGDGGEERGPWSAPASLEEDGAGYDEDEDGDDGSSVAEAKKQGIDRDKLYKLQAPHLSLAITQVEPVVASFAAGHVDEEEEREE